LAKLLRSHSLEQHQQKLALETFNEKFNIVIQGSLKRAKQDQANELQQMYADLVTSA